MITVQISILLTNADTGFVAGSLGIGMRNLKAVRLKISSNLDEKERKELDEEEQKFWKSFNITKTKGFDVPSTKNLAGAYDKYSEYNDLLMKYLKKYGFMIPNKTDKTDMG